MRNERKVSPKENSDPNTTISREIGRVLQKPSNSSYRVGDYHFCHCHLYLKRFPVIRCHTRKTYGSRGKFLISDRAKTSELTQKQRLSWDRGSIQVYPCHISSLYNIWFVCWTGYK